MTAKKRLDPADNIESAAHRAITHALYQTREYLRHLTRSVPRDAETVHQLRISTRRAAAACAIFRDSCRDRDYRRWTRRLKQVRWAAGRARDLDVLLDRERQKKRPDKRLIASLQAQRDKAQILLYRLKRKWKPKSQWRRQQTALVRRLQHRAQLCPTHSPWSATAQAALSDCVTRFQSLGTRSTRSMADLHAFRIQAKRLRYTLEWISPLLPAAEGKRAVKHLKRIQDQLGLINDHCVAQSLYKSATTSGKKTRKLVRRERRRLRKSLAGWADWWTPQRQAEFCRELRELFDPSTTPAVP